MIERFLTPGSGWNAQELGGSAVCDVQQVTPSGPGFCTQEALAADNAGYELNATPAPPLKHVIAEAGASC